MTSSNAPSTAPSQEMGEELATSLARLRPITLSEMDGVQLLNRVDTKYVFPRHLLLGFLERLTPHYRNLSVGDSRLQNYRTLYFDTEDAAMYRAHHNGVAQRMKVRKRWYVGSNLAFLEVKRRDNKKRTIKKRVRLPASASDQATYDAWVDKNLAPYELAELHPFTWTTFNRITLVNNEGTERVTLDTDVAWSIGDGTERAPDAATFHRAQEDFCIAELKRDGRNAKTECMRVLREGRVFPASFSKYAVGSALIHPHLKKGGFKPTLRKLGAFTHD